VNSLRAETGIESGLPAAGLGRREIHPHPGPVQNIDHCLANLWEEGVNQAGDEKLDCFGHAISGKIVLHKLCKRSHNNQVFWYDYRLGRTKR
jgi:hypothetical protein